LRASNKSLQESTSSTNSRLERALEALKIAGQNAATARADCDAAESFASSLANQVETLRSTIEETKRSAQQVYKEHKEIASEARLIESKLIAQVSGFARTKKEHQSTLLDHEKIKKQCDEMKQIQISMQHQMDKKDQQIKRLQQDIDGRDAMEDARKERSELIEKELREARALLVEVSSTQQESESTASILKETIEKIKIENNELHQKLAETQKKMRSDLEKSQELLASAEKESQMLRVRASAHDADIKRVQAEKASSDKKITSLRHRLETFERRLWHHDSADSTPQINDVATSYGLESDGARKKFIIPPLVPGSKLQIKSQSCSICGKEASGVMKSCQCSSISCDKRAHSTCISTQSTKSFGIGLNLITPARKIVLCSHEKTPQQN